MRTMLRVNAFRALLISAAFWGSASPKSGPTDLFLRGYTVIPTPQKVRLHGGDFEFNDEWKYRSDVARDHIAVRTLLADLKNSHAIDLNPEGSQPGPIVRLAIAPGTVKTGDDPEIEAQGYLLQAGPERIEIVGNSNAGLFYGVQTLLQLLRPRSDGNRTLPSCTIEDWPAYPLRFLHWDTKHHQDRVETLKRFLDWSARFKINRIGFELEDKFEYPSNPVIGAPGAFTTEQLQGIVDYGLERYIQVVPQIQSPAHMAYVLKHPEFSELRADGNNYQSCLCDERTYELIFSMYEDVIKATRGVGYFHVSTDEVYYAGICARCDKPHSPENASLQWVEFAQRAHAFLAGRGRRMLAWIEYPVLPHHIRLLPSDLIDAVLGDDSEQVRAEDERGIRQLIYTSMQGDEPLFPNLLTLEGDLAPARGRLESAYERLSARGKLGRPKGVYGAAWDDSGLHNETFWLGWATVAQYGWTPGIPSVEQNAAEFMSVFYGPRVNGLIEVYRRLQAQARFYDRSWDRVVSRVRGPAYGDWDGKGKGTTRYDRTLPAPPIPALPLLEIQPVYVERYRQLAADAGRTAVENDILVHSLYENIPKADQNRYNLEVLLSLAAFTGHHNRMILGLKAIEDRLSSARDAAGSSNPKGALESLSKAYERARTIVAERNHSYWHLKHVWEKSRFPKGQDVNGRKFYHVMDDTKDHLADRRPDLSYLIAPEESIELEKWMERLAEVARSYARSHNLPAPGFEE